MKRILISSPDSIVTQIALLKDNLLFNFSVDTVKTLNKQYNIYKGFITKIETSLNAVFVDYGDTKQGFLPFREISPFYFKKKLFNLCVSENFKQVLTKGDELIVQIVKEERGGKGALLTTFIRLIGNYLILLPNTTNTNGISKKITDFYRDDIKYIFSRMSIPKGMSVIARTACCGKSIEELEWDLDILLSKWFSIKFAFNFNWYPCLLFSSNCFYLQFISDFFQFDVEEIIIDNYVIFKKIIIYFEMVQPFFLKNIKFYNEKVSLFSKFKVDLELETVFCRTLKLPSGGMLSIDCTEALVSIDVNSAKSSSTLSSEETAIKNNLEATIEIARQLRLRDLAGIVVIDFIDMSNIKNRNFIEKKLVKELENDKAKIIIGNISQFGLLEFSRQRTRKIVSDFSKQICTQCDGKGVTQSVETLATLILQKIYFEVTTNVVKSIDVVLPFIFFNFFMQYKKEQLFNIEKKFNVILNFYIDYLLIFPHYKIFVQKKIKTNYSLVSKNEFNLNNKLIVSATDIIYRNTVLQIVLLSSSFYYYLFSFSFIKKVKDYFKNY